MVDKVDVRTVGCPGSHPKCPPATPERATENHARRRASEIWPSALNRVWLTLVVIAFIVNHPADIVYVAQFNPDGRTRIDGKGGTLRTLQGAIFNKCALEHRQGAAMAWPC